MTDVVVVTGASRGIGLSVARTLGAAGYAVVSLSRSAPPDQEGAAQIAHVPVDLSRTDDLPDLCRRVREEFGDPYALVNNSGWGAEGLLATQHVRDIEKVIALNLTAPMVLTKHFGRAMLRRRRGRIVTIGSIVGRTGYSGLSAYSATKAGVEGFSRAASREFGRAGVTVNVVAPGFVRTGMTEALGEQHLATISRRSPLGLAEPEDVAGAVAYLLSDAARRVTGTVLTVDGGATA
ncbi:SDR family NAD(P)-dependent oxidoreductase [Kineococcus sp. SYSU DK001]|uniref:SDR family NAD(P)-dependent oxidoreductase n=1 Tax=Kineococcus sp. SYSU DK001 TaxID=3383122 RepID=UPI003D7CC286